MKLSKEQIEESVKAKGYVWFDGDKDFDGNVLQVEINGVNYDLMIADSPT